MEENNESTAPRLQWVLNPCDLLIGLTITYLRYYYYYWCTFL